jgi:uncharacterized protein (TIGR02594 family)
MLRRITIAAAIGCALLAADNADARPYHRHHHHPRHQVHRVPGEASWVVGPTRDERFPAAATASLGPMLWSQISETGSSLVGIAQRYLGSNPTGWAHNWCAQFLNAVVLPQAGYRGSGSAAAISFASYGRAVGPQPGAIAVMQHHVAIVERVENGGVYTISGNHGHRVAEGFYAFRRILAFRWPA